MAKRTELTGAALFRETTLEQWQVLLQEYEVGNIEVYPDKQQIKICCAHPDHADKTPSSNINVKFGNYHCWSCHNDTVFDPIKLVSLIADCDYGEAYGIFCEIFDLRPSRKAAETDYQEESEDKKLLMQFVEFSNYALRSVFADYDAGKTHGYPECYYKAVEWLRTRGVTLNDLNIFSIGVLMGSDTLNSAATLWFFNTGKPLDEAGDFLQNYNYYFGKVNTLDNFGALLFPHFITPTQVGRFQIRNDFLREGTPSLKFFFVTPGDKAPEHIDRLVECSTGFFALDTWAKIAGKTGDFSIGVTEGATDTIATYKAQLDKFGHIVFPSIAVPGTGAKDMDRLVSFGIQEVRFLQDHPSERGDTVVGHYIRQATMLDVLPLKWPENIQDKDISKLYQRAGAEAVCQLVLNDANYEQAHEHVLRALTAAVEWEDAGPERILKLTEERMACLGSSAAQRAFIAAVEKTYDGISSKALESQVAIEDDTLDGFMARLQRDIETEYEFLYKQTDIDENKTCVALMRKETGLKFYIPLTSATLVELVAEPFGARTDWAVQAQMPTEIRFRKRGKKKEPVPPTVLRREIHACVRGVLEKIAKFLPERYDKYEDLSNGVHQIRYEGEEAILLINGNDRYIGKFEGTKRKPKVEWTMYFPEKVITEHRKPWTTFITCIDDLKDGNDVCPKKLWEDIYNTIYNGWSFENQEADATWLTALALYSAIYDFSNRTLMTIVTGERESGKSKLVKDMFGGRRPIGSRMPQVEFYNYLEFPSTSEPGIRQEFAGADGVQRRGLVLDEFENDGPKSAAKMDALFGTIRGMLDGKATVKKGTKGGRSLTYDLRFPAILAGILEFSDQTGAVESRVYRVETRREADRQSPMRTIGAMFPHMDGDDVTKRLTIGMFRFAQLARIESDRILEAMNYENFSTRLMDVKSSDRPNVSAATVGGIMALCGFTDLQIEKRLALVLTKMNKDQSSRTELPGDKIWNDLLSMVVQLPEKQEEGTDFFADYRQTFNRVSFNDALFDPYLRQFIGKKDFFQAFCIYEDKYMIIDRYYLRHYLRQESMNWTKFCTLLHRRFDHLVDYDARALARKHGDMKYAQPSKKMMCIVIPEEITQFWKEEGKANGSKSDGTGSAGGDSDNARSVSGTDGDVEVVTKPKGKPPKGPGVAEPDDAGENQ